MEIVKTSLPGVEGFSAEIPVGPRGALETLVRPLHAWLAAQGELFVAFDRALPEERAPKFAGEWALEERWLLVFKSTTRIAPLPAEANVFIGLWEWSGLFGSSLEILKLDAPGGGEDSRRVAAEYFKHSGPYELENFAKWARPNGPALWTLALGGDGRLLYFYGAIECAEKEREIREIVAGASYWNAVST